MRVIIVLLLALLNICTYAQNDSGTVLIKIKNGNITFKRTQPPPDVQTYIITKMQNEKDGHYRITYKPGIDAMYDLKKKKVDSPAAETFKVIGGLAMLTLSILYVVSKL